MNNRIDEIFVGLTVASLTVIFGIALGFGATRGLSELIFRALQAL